MPSLALPSPRAAQPAPPPTRCWPASWRRWGSRERACRQAQSALLAVELGVDNQACRVAPSLQHVLQLWLVQTPFQPQCHALPPNPAGGCSRRAGPSGRPPGTVGPSPAAPAAHRPEQPAVRREGRAVRRSGAPGGGQSAGPGGHFLPPSAGGLAGGAGERGRWAGTGGVQVRWHVPLGRVATLACRRPLLPLQSNSL